MAFTPLTDAQCLAAIKELEKAAGNISVAARALKISRRALHNRLDKAEQRGLAPAGTCRRKAASEKQEQPNMDHFKAEFSDKSGMIYSLSGRIRTVEDALKVGEVDQERWEVDRYLLNKWEVGAKLEDGQIVVEPLWQVKVWLRRKAYQPVQDALKILIKELKKKPAKYDFPPVPASLRDRLCYEISPVDLHSAKLAWARETGEDYDTEIAERIFRRCMADLAAKTAGMQLEQIVLVIGNDWFQVDNQYGATAKGTVQDIDSRFQRAFLRSRTLLVETIEMLAGKAPITVKVIPGNHDYERIFYLGEVLDARFCGTDRITIDNSPRLRKYLRYGTNLIGYTHGSEEKMQDLPLIMAREEPQHWAETSHHEWHLGHLHKSKEVKFVAGDSFQGVRVRYLPSLCGTDAWHYRMGYVKGLRACEAYLWNYHTGYEGHFSSNVPETAFAKEAM